MDYQEFEVVPEILHGDVKPQTLRCGFPRQGINALPASGSGGGTGSRVCFVLVFTLSFTKEHVELVKVPEWDLCFSSEVIPTWRGIQHGKALVQGCFWGRVTSFVD